MDKKLVIIPTYNEKENIADILQAVLALEGNFHVLVIDDGSPDGTADIVRTIAEEHVFSGAKNKADAPENTYPSAKQQVSAESASDKGAFSGASALISAPENAPLSEADQNRIHLIERSGKLGLGTAYLTGFLWALEQGYDYVFEMDADFSHNPADLLRLYRACAEEGADLAIGSRYCNGVSVVDWPIGRIIMSYFASAYVRSVLRMHIYDTTAGFVCYSRKVLEGIDLDAVRMKGYGFQIEMKYTAFRKGFQLKEVPIVFTNRQKGTSKMSGGIFSEALWGVVGLRLRRW